MGEPADAGHEELEQNALNLERERRFEAARDAFDAALKANPVSQTSAEGRARIALKLREADAADHCARALTYRDDDPEMQGQMIATVASTLGTAAIPLLEGYLDRYPLNVAALELMAHLQAESGAGEAFVDRFHTALSKEPESRQLHMSYWNTLSRAGRHRQALESMDANRSLFGDDRAFAMLEIAVAAHSGQPERAGRLLEQQDDRPDAQLARGLNRLQTQRPAEAAQFLEDVVSGQPDNLEAWSLLELAWRVTGNPRHDWLAGKPRLYGPSQLELGTKELEMIAAALRTMHQSSAQPIGQSVRGGTQTPGDLFARTEPEIGMLTKALADAIRRFVGELPPADQKHPLLRYRDSGIAFGPSWSVRFTDSGHHAAHFHPGGILSSACYISVPETLADEAEKPGWLEIGRPPAELGLDIPPLDTFEPRPGRLVLFPSYLFHGTRPFAGGERMSVAFDLVPVPSRQVRPATPRSRPSSGSAPA